MLAQYCFIQIKRMSTLKKLIFEDQNSNEVKYELLCELEDLCDGHDMDKCMY